MSALAALSDALRAVPADKLKVALIDAVDKLLLDNNNDDNNNNKPADPANRKVFAPSIMTAVPPPPPRAPPPSSTTSTAEHESEERKFSLSPMERKLSSVGSLPRKESDTINQEELHQRECVFPVDDKSPADATAGVSVAGIGISQLSLQMHKDLLKKKVYKWVMFRIDKHLIRAQQVGMKKSGASYSDFVSMLPCDEARFGVVDVDLINSDGCKLSRIVFVHWAPDTAPAMHKMKSASSAQHFKNLLQGVSVELQASDLDEMCEEGLMSRIRDSMTRR